MPKKIIKPKSSVKKKISKKKKRFSSAAQFGIEFEKLAHRKPLKFNFVRPPEIPGDPFRAAELQKNVRFSDAMHRPMPAAVLINKSTGSYVAVTKATRGELGTAPAHYSHGKYTPWEIVDDWNLEYYTGNAMKYVCRHKHKGKPVEDIQKAIDCLIKYKTILEKEKV